MILKLFTCIFFVFSSVLAISCSDEVVSKPLIGDNENKEEKEAGDTVNDSENAVYNILPVGDSRVQGDRPDDESYRFELWKLLLDSDISFDFVGTRRDLAEYPSYRSMSFDIDHQGVGGATTSSILAELDEVLKEIDSDIVLLGIGGNDLDRGESVVNTISNINLIIDRFQSENNEVTIIVEQIAPAVSSYMTSERMAILMEFNKAISDVANSQTTETSLVVPVNMFEDWKDDYFADDVHYNEEGAKEVASRYFKVIDSVLTNR